MKLLAKSLITGLLAVTALTATAQTAKSQKHADRTLKMRQSVFTLIGSNMGALGAMAKGKIPVNAELAKKNATRINQLSFMIEDYLRTDTSKFKLETDALDNIWQEQEKFNKRIAALIDASENLKVAADSGDESAIKKAIGRVGKSCGGCHDDFKAE